ncbi:MAG: carboxymuconolactone decarboxylase family protein [Gammaproteobacteria bacterium]|nr:carboxymuconolactone decarboxylase family protein [Gammaproteobacteria bacterium]
MTVHHEGHMPEAMEDLKHGIRMMRERSPNTWSAWAAYVESVLQPTALDRKTKELVALGMSITAQCKYCIGVHVQKCLDADATEAELIDVCHVAMLMGGSPAMTYIADVNNALELYREKQEKLSG